MNFEVINSESNSNQVFNSTLTFFKIFLRRIFLLPYLLIFAYEALKTIEISRFNLWEVITLYLISLALLYVIPLIILHYLEKKHFEKIFDGKKIKCSLCNKIVEPNFKLVQKTFNVPLCDYHVNLHHSFLKTERENIYKFYNFLFGISFPIVLIGAILLSIAGIMSGIVDINPFVGKLQIFTILFTLFPIQLFTHVFFSLKITKLIKRSLIHP